MFRGAVPLARRALARAKTTTGLVGLAVEPQARPALMGLYGKTLAALEDVPAASEYRKHVESMTKERLAVVEGTEDLRAIESTIGAGQVEQLIRQAEDELALIPTLVAARAFDTYDGATSKESILTDLKLCAWPTVVTQLALELRSPATLPLSSHAPIVPCPSLVPAPPTPPMQIRRVTLARARACARSAAVASSCSVTTSPCAHRPISPPSRRWSSSCPPRPRRPPRRGPPRRASVGDRRGRASPRDEGRDGARIHILAGVANRRHAFPDGGADASRQGSIQRCGCRPCPSGPERYKSYRLRVRRILRRRVHSQKDERSCV